MADIPRYLVAIIVVALISLYCAPKEAGAARNTRVLCLECHPDSASMMSKSVVHQPVKLGMCTACHNPHASKHSKLLGESLKELCYKCHDKKKNFSGNFTHEPIDKGGCIECHDPHASNNKKLLKVTSGAACYSCHPKDELITGKNVHPEVKKGNCLLCHEPHVSQVPGLLVKDRVKLCAKCHSGGGAKFKQAHQGYSVTGTDCLGCHNPHSSDNVSVLSTSLHEPFENKECNKCHVPGKTKLVKQGISLCTDCHESTLEGFNRIYSHLVSSATENLCLNCHGPHGSNVANLLRDREDRVCFSCHVEAEASLSTKYKHPKLEKCSDCHSSHGSNTRYFMLEGEGTCSLAGCHPTQGVFTHPVGEDVIDPRAKEPMSCVTCHDPMGAPEKLHLRLDPDKDLCIQCHQL